MNRLQAPGARQCFAHGKPAAGLLLEAFPQLLAIVAMIALAFEMTSTAVVFGAVAYIPIAQAP